ncbi:MAG: NfeD family protein [Christensenellales bacterium]
MKRLAAGAAAALVLALGIMFVKPAYAQSGGSVMVVDVKGEVNAAMSAYIAQSIKEAEEAGMSVVLDIDTYGGQIIEADNIKKTLLSSGVPVDAFIRHNAFSAGVLISVSCERIIMTPSAAIGAAETIPNDEKTLSTWVGMLKSAAQARGRDTRIIAAMADKRVVIEGLTQKDELLTLGAKEALACGLSEGTAATLEGALSLLGYDGYETVIKPMSFSVRAAQFLTSVTVMSILFLVAIVCLGIEIFTPGFGVFGIVSFICFALYFGGSFLAGFAEWWSVALFLAGVVCTGIEITIPGFGIFGILGIIGIGAGLLFSARDIETFLTVLGVGVAGSIVALPLLFKLLKRLGLVRRIVLFENMTAEEGYISHNINEGLTGRDGVALTDLRPAGFARIGGERVEVVSSGAYIDKGARITVIKYTPGRVEVDEII